MNIKALGHEFSEKDLLCGLNIAETLFGLDVLGSLIERDQEHVAYYLCSLHEGVGASLFQTSPAAIQTMLEPQE